ncbi:hypothetical protein QMK38_19200 [Lysinibacillus fusiformis]|nr:hypothetical protein [Lysinibacillus fusiformis]
MKWHTKVAMSGNERVQENVSVLSPTSNQLPFWEKVPTNLSNI